MSQEKPHPRIGVAAIIYNQQGQLVVGKRKGSHGAGTWQLPGGHLEHGESITACAEREALEETGLVLRGKKIVAVTNDVFEQEGKHYVTLFVSCEMVNPAAEPQVLEPEKCEGWYWRTWEDLRQIGSPVSQGEKGEKLFLPLVHLFEQTQTTNLDELRL